MRLLQTTSAPSIRAILVLDQDGERIVAKYFTKAQGLGDYKKQKVRGGRMCWRGAQ